MAAIKSVLGWLGRQAILFVALVAAILIYWATKPSFESFRQLRETAAALSDGEGELRRFSTTQIDLSNAHASAFYRLSYQQIDRRSAAARRDRERLAGACRSDLGTLVTKGAVACTGAGTGATGGAAGVCAGGAGVCPGVCARAGNPAASVSTAAAAMTTFFFTKPSTSGD